MISGYYISWSRGHGTILSGSHPLLKQLLQVLHIRQGITQLFGQFARGAIGGHSHRLGCVAERQLHNLVALGFAEDDAVGGILARQPHVFVEGREVEVELAGVSANSHHSTLHIIILPPS